MAPTPPKGENCHRSAQVEPQNWQGFPALANLSSCSPAGKRAGRACRGSRFEEAELHESCGRRARARPDLRCARGGMHRRAGLSRPHHRGPGALCRRRWRGKRHPGPGGLVAEFPRPGPQPADPAGAGAEPGPGPGDRADRGSGSQCPRLGRGADRGCQRQRAARGGLGRGDAHRIECRAGRILADRPLRRRPARARGGAARPGCGGGQCTGGAHGASEPGGGGLYRSALLRGVHGAEAARPDLAPADLARGALDLRGRRGDAAGTGPGRGAAVDHTLRDPGAGGQCAAPEKPAGDTSGRARGHPAAVGDRHPAGAARAHGQRRSGGPGPQPPRRAAGGGRIRRRRGAHRRGRGAALAQPCGWAATCGWAGRAVRMWTAGASGRR